MSDELSDVQLMLFRGNGAIESSTGPRLLPLTGDWPRRVCAELGPRESGRVAISGLHNSLAVWRLAGVAADAEPRMLVLVRRPPAWLASGCLTERQREVSEYAAAGATVPEIATTLALSRNTVRTHLKAAYRELGVSNRVELARAVALLDVAL